MEFLETKRNMCYYSNRGRTHMIRERITLDNGKTFDRLTPENDLDVQELRRMEQQGEIQDRSSFADDLAEEGNEIVDT